MTTGTIDNRARNPGGVGVELLQPPRVDARFIDLERRVTDLGEQLDRIEKKAGAVEAAREKVIGFFGHRITVCAGFIANRCDAVVDALVNGNRGKI